MRNPCSHRGFRAASSLLAAACFGLPGTGLAADTLSVFKAGDTAKASVVNANFRLVWDRLQSLASENRLLSAENLSLNKRVDSLEKSKPQGANLDSLHAKITGMNAQIQSASSQAQEANSRIQA